MKKLLTHIRAFHDDEQGSMSIELLLVVPILVWVFLSTFVYFDVFRVETNSIRATIAIAEMFSREDTVDPVFMRNSRRVLRELTYEENNPDVRVTVYEYDPSITNANRRFRVVWSEGRGFGPRSTESLRSLARDGRLPVMEAVDHAIYIETRTQYDAPFNIGLGPFTVTNLEDRVFRQDLVVRPRGGRLCWDPDTSVDDDEICSEP